MFKSIFVSDKKIALILHGIAWIILVILPLFLNSAFGGDDPHRLYQFYVHTFSAVATFYLGYLWLVPKFFLQDKKIVYVIILFGIILGTYGITSFINDSLLSDPVRDANFLENYRKVTGDNAPSFKIFGFFNHIIASILVSGFAMGLAVMKKLKQNEEKQK